MSDFEKQFKIIISSLSECFGKEIKKRNPDIVKRLAKVKLKSKDFFATCELAQHDINWIMVALFDIPPQKNINIVGQIANGLYEHFIGIYIRRIEGDCCCVDKATFVKNMTVEALKNKKNISLYAEYDDEPRQAYWSPETIKDTDTAMEMFWNWYLLRDKQQGEEK